MTKSISVKKGMTFILLLAIVCVFFVGLVIRSNNNANVLAANGETIIKLRVNHPNMTVNGETAEIDPGRGTVPVIISDRTLLPVRGVIEAVGGTVGWEQATQTVTLHYKEDEIQLVIDSETAYLNGEANTLDSAPTIINERTMLPIRFIAESFQFTVDWEQSTQTVTVTVPVDSVPAQTAAGTGEPVAAIPEVYMTTDISSEGLVAVYEKLGFVPEGKVAIKMSTGEPPNSNYLRPELIQDLVQSVNGTIVECNTAYGGSRASTKAHKQVAKDHGFTKIADVDIMDEDGSLSIPVTGGDNLTENFVGAHLANYDSMITLSHFKGHAMGGFGGAIKNMSIGIGSSEGKAWIHTAGNSKTSPWGGDQDKFLESMAEANKAVVDYLDGKVVYINVMNRLSVDCDCNGNPAEPDMHDIGILASTDPVALDQACVDLVYAQKDGDGKSLVQRIESRNGLHTLEQAAKIGLGSREYNLISID